MMKLSKLQRAALYQMFGGKCAYCGCDLPEKRWHADHIEPVYREWWKRLMPEFKHEFVDGAVVKVKQDRTVRMTFSEHDNIANFFPACVPCNIDKSVYPLEDWRRVLEQRVRVLRDNYSAFRHAERFGLVAQVKTQVEFYFEQLRAVSGER